jgi:hypothetical protein
MVGYANFGISPAPRILLIQSSHHLPWNAIEGTELLLKVGENRHPDSEWSREQIARQPIRNEDSRLELRHTMADGLSIGIHSHAGQL